MAEALKHMFFKEQFIHDLAESIRTLDAEFDSDQFKGLVWDESWAGLELKAKMRHVTHSLYKTLPDDYPKTLGIIKQVAPQFTGFDVMTFMDFVECYGRDHYDLSMLALGEMTVLCSSEFAVRPFLDQDLERGLSYLKQWMLHDDWRVRRLASEGCRPRLPWAMALPKLKKDPTPILPVLGKLKDDESEDVRRSVANNLNDISKDNPDVVLDLAEEWFGQSEHGDRIVKHACRSLLKSGNTRAMRLFGFGDPAQIVLQNLRWEPESISIGEDLRFSFDLLVETEKSNKVRLEYAVYYVKAKGNLSKKIFQLRESEFKPGKHAVTKKQLFQDFSTRTHYPGEHRIAIIVNGVEKGAFVFELRA